MRVLRCALAGALALAAAATAASAHHSYSMFDRTKTTTIEGTVWTWEMINPHSFLWVVVMKPDGTTEKWGMEGAGVQMLQRAGVTRSAVKTGDKVTVDLHPLRDGRTGGQLMRVDGHKRDLWRQFDAELRPGPWCLGEAFSALDIYLIPMTRWRPRRDWFAEQLPRLHAVALAAESLPVLRPVIERNFGA